MAVEIKKILLVDDDQNIRLLARMALEGLTGWQVFVAASGSEAIDMALAQRPDVILLDIMMPGMDGTATFGCLKEQESLKDVPVIFLTSKVQTHEVESHLKLGAAGVVAKPFDPMTLHTDIMQIIEGL